MSDAPSSNPKAEPLQFDRAVQGAAPAARLSGPTIACSRCKTQIRSYYYHVDGKSFCAKCKQEAERASGASKSTSAFVRAIALGIVAAVVGAGIYYGVIALLNLEIGIVAILIGFMVGFAVRMGARGGGGRRYQILAAALTYWSVGLAYAPVAYKGFIQARTERIATLNDSITTRQPPADSVEAAAGDATAADSAAGEESAPAPPVSSSGGATQPGTRVTLLALGATMLLIFALPVMVVMGSLPSGLISALIIGFGILQAWRMTDGTTVAITGPYRVGAGFGTPVAAP